MRELRAWTGDKMCYEIREIEFQHDCLVVGDDPDSNSHVLSEISLMDYTGLRDKNDKKIYEDDIVRILYTDWMSKSETDKRALEQYLIDISNIGTIVFDHCCYKIRFGDASGSIHCGTHGFIEVIGNIYEPPELIK